MYTKIKIINLRLHLICAIKWGVWNEVKCLLIIFVIARNSHLETKSRNRVQDKVVSGCAAYWFVLGARYISRPQSSSFGPDAGSKLVSLHSCNVNRNSINHWKAVCIFYLIVSSCLRLHSWEHVFFLSVKFAKKFPALFGIEAYHHGSSN